MLCGIGSLCVWPWGLRMTLNTWCQHISQVEDRHERRCHGMARAGRDIPLDLICFCKWLSVSKLPANAWFRWLKTPQRWKTFRQTAVGECYDVLSLLTCLPSAAGPVALNFQHRIIGYRRLNFCAIYGSTTDSRYSYNLRSQGCPNHLPSDSYSRQKSSFSSTAFMRKPRLMAGSVNYFYNCSYLNRCAVIICVLIASYVVDFKPVYTDDGKVDAP